VFKIDIFEAAGLITSGMTIYHALVVFKLKFTGQHPPV
jgi:hypothetical protein